VRIAAELGVTGLLAVELFETRRPAGERAGHAPAQLRPLDHRGARTRSSSSTCGVLDLPLGSPGLAAPATAMANVLGGDDGTSTIATFT